MHADGTAPRWRSAGFPCVVALMLATVGCGVPADGTGRHLSAEDVPYRLLDSGSAEPPSPSPTADATTSPQVFLVDADGLLVAQPLDSPRGTAHASLDAVLRALTSGPTEQQRSAGLSSALGTDAALELVDVSISTARVALGPPDSDVPPEQLPVAVAQIVLSCTSVDGVDQVVFTQGGSRLDVPLPDGELTSEPLARDDYRELLAERPAE